jgi:hypothetical protein
LSALNNPEDHQEKSLNASVVRPVICVIGRSKYGQQSPGRFRDGRHSGKWRIDARRMADFKNRNVSFKINCCVKYLISAPLIACHVLLSVRACEHALSLHTRLK